MQIGVLAEGEKNEIQDWESILSDIADFKQFKTAYPQVVNNPVIFQRNFARVNGPKGEVIPFIPYWYQEDITADESTQKILVKSRQIGFTVQEAFIRFWKGITIPGYSCFFYHLREQNVKKYLDTIRGLNDNLIEPLRFEYEKNRGIFIELSNRSSWLGMSSGALQSGRGFTGDLTLDEYAIAINSEKILASAASIAVRGFDLTIGSTPYGKHNEYHRLVNECGWDTDRIHGSVTEYRTIESEGRKLFKEGYFEAVTLRESKKLMREWINKKTVSIKRKDEKKFRETIKRVKRNNASDYEIFAASWTCCPDINWVDIMKLGLSYDSLLQEFFLYFADEASCMLTMEEIANCVVQDMILIDPIVAVPSVDRSVYCGVDPSYGKVNETAWLFAKEPVWDNNKMLVHPWEVLWYETTWEKRNRYVPRLVEQIRRFKPSKVYIDGGGVGIPVSEDLIELHGLSDGLIEPINLVSKSIYEPLIYNMVSLIQAGLVMIPDDPRLIDQLYSLEKTLTVTGKAHFTGKIRSSDGQDDLVWALALAISPGSGKSKGRYRSESINLGGSFIIKGGKKYE